MDKAVLKFTFVDSKTTENDVTLVTVEVSKPHSKYKTTTQFAYLNGVWELGDEEASLPSAFESIPQLTLDYVLFELRLGTKDLSLTVLADGSVKRSDEPNLVTLPSLFVDKIARKKDVNKTKAVEIASEMMGCTPTSIWYYLSGKRKPSPAIRNLICLLADQL